MTTLAPELEALIRQLPKAELHLHLEGSIQPEMALSLARKHGISLPGAAEGIEGLRRHYRFASFEQFLTLYLAISQCLVDAGDFTAITVDLARVLAAQNVRYAEVTITPMTHVERGVPEAVLLEGLAEGRARAHRAHGVELAWVLDIMRDRTEHAEPTLELALRGREQGVIGLGLSGQEQARWPLEFFASIFSRAREGGLHSLPHAGEFRGPEGIWESLRWLGAERLGHGVRCLEDPALVEYLAEHQIPLEVCPSSNVALHVCPGLEQHPLPKLMEAGLSVSLASDDPPLFSTSLTDEYLRCAATFGWSVETVLSLAAAAVEHSFLPESRKRELLTAQRSLVGGG
ncbi:adenosine deaminase [Archangium lansingense]|uniref:Adenosine deaminase n=1 Tax=Archangium lansingense TaxID=2995310 RepID=A0ABT4A813_9BACT|nr:adenosine deaminase [Archangium lansinium]MCY1077077.1 adenosine deaminase [Archangium lansinium]